MVKSKRESTSRRDYQGIWFRLVVLIVSGIIFYFWNILIAIVFIINFIIAIITGKPNQSLSDFGAIWVKEIYRAVQYLLFISEERPFPFKSIQFNNKNV